VWVGIIKSIETNGEVGEIGRRGYTFSFGENRIINLCSRYVYNDGLTTIYAITIFFG
jgi:hypothetical protein